MTPNPRRALAAATLTAGALAAAMLPATAATDYGAAPSYQEFRSSTYVDTDSQYVVNGDEPVATDGKLRQFYDQMVGDKHTGRQVEDGLIVNRVNGQDDKWSASQVGNLTYCVSTKFGSDYSRMVTAMAAVPASGRRPRRRSTSSTSPRRTPAATPATTACCSPWSR